MRRVRTAVAVLAVMAPAAATAHADAAVTANRSGTDIAVTLVAGQAQVRLGHQVALTVTTTNLGPLPAADVVVANPLPTSLTLIRSSPSVGRHDPALASWHLGALAVGETATLTLVVRAQARGHVATPAALVAASPMDANELNNVDSVPVDILPPLADLVTAQVVTPEGARPGDVVTCTITAANVGPDNVDGAVVRTLGLEFVSATPSVGTFDPVSQAWLVGPLIAGAAPATLTGKVRLGAPGTQAGMAVIEAAGTVDPDPANNVASATLGSTAPRLDIVVGTTSMPAVERGREQTFTVTASNNGPASATGLVVADRLPAGHTIVAATGPGAYDPVSSLWTIGDLAAGTSATLVITATAAAAGSWLNAAVLSRVDQWDTDATNNTAGAAATVDESADLEITTSAVPNVIEPGDVVTSAVTVTNHGPNDASTVEAVVLEVPGAEIVETLSGTPFDRARRVWTIGTLRPGQSDTLVLRQRVSNPGITVNTAQITQSGTPDPDLVGNVAHTAVPAPGADLVVSAGRDVARVGVGGEVLLTVVATNLGPQVAQGVSVIDMLPAELAIVEVGATVGEYDATTGVWRIGRLLPGEIQTMRVHAIAGWPGDLRHRAVITSARPIDPEQDNNTAEIALTIVAAPGEASRDPWPGALTVGGELGWWLTSSGAIGLFLVLAGAALILVRRRDPLSEL